MKSLNPIYKRYVDVDVTRDDMLNGTRGDSTSCPLAIALKRQFPMLYVRVYSQVAYIGEAEYTLTKQTAFLVHRIDRGLFVAPQTVRLYNPKKRIMG